MIGILFAVVALALAFTRPEEFYRAYLLGFMCWLGVSLGSMAILMIRHLTGGGWGTVIRRILGAAMRTLPLLAILFIPVILGMHKLYIWAQPLGNIQDKHLREHLEQIHADVSHRERLHHSRDIYFAIWNCFPSYCRNGRSRPTTPALLTTAIASRLSQAPVSSSTRLPFLLPPSIGSCRLTPVGSRPSSA